MYKKLITLKEIKDCSFIPKDESNLLLTKIDSLDLFNTSTLQSKVILTHSPFSIFCFDDILLEQKANGAEISVYSNETHIKDIPGKYYLWKRCKYQNKLYLKGKTNSKKTVFSLDLTTLNVDESPLNFVPALGANRRLLVYKRGKLIFCSDESANTVWEIDVSEMGKWKQGGVEYNGSVLQALMDTTSNMLIFSISVFYVIGVDPDSGQIMWKRKFPGGTNNIYLHNGKLYVMSIGRTPTYHVLNTKNGVNDSEVDLSKTWKELADSTPFTKKEIRFHLLLTRHLIDDNFLYVSITNKRQLGVFDKSTAELIQLITLEGSGSRIPALNAPIVIGKYIFQLDGDNQLHIFQKI